MSRHVIEVHAAGKRRGWLDGFGRLVDTPGSAASYPTAQAAGLDAAWRNRRAEGRGADVQYLATTDEVAR